MDWKKLKSSLVILAITLAVSFNAWTTAQVYEMRGRLAVVERDVSAAQTAIAAQDDRTAGMEGSIRDIAVNVAFIRGEMEGR